jgi:hypothetical protein
VGKFIYDWNLTVDFDDRLLAHLEYVITAKLQRSEAFTFSWRDDERLGDSRTSIWLHPSTPLVFKYDEGRPPRLNSRWIDELAKTTSSRYGMRIVAEPPEPAVTS